MKVSDWEQNVIEVLCIPIFAAFYLEFLLCTCFHLFNLYLFTIGNKLVWLHKNSQQPNPVCIIIAFIASLLLLNALFVLQSDKLLPHSLMTIATNYDSDSLHQFTV